MTHAHVLACGLSGHGASCGVGDTLRSLAVARPLRVASEGFGKLVENFFKKVLDRNRRSVNIVDAPFTGN